MALLIICDDRNLTPWVDSLKEIDPNLEVRVYPNEGNISDIEFILCWKHPRGILKKYPNLKCISSMGAGVDHLLSDPNLPVHIPIVRIVDPELAMAMSEFVMGLILNHLRGYTICAKNQQKKIWKAIPFKIAKNVSIGIMGMGILGQDLARKLNMIGFKVNGWDASSKEIENIKIYVGDTEFGEFLKNTEILICLLPLTHKTSAILNKSNLKKLPDNAYLINVARGEHVVDEDLIELIDNGKLSGACLDVFSIEPLPEDHPFWTHPNIMITPHIASLTNPKSVAPQILENYQRIKSGQPFLNQVSIESGY